MNRAASLPFRRAGIDQAPVVIHRVRGFLGRVGLLLLGTGLLTAAFAPSNQFYLAWVGLAPWLVVLHGTRSQWTAFGWSWLGGTFFFLANMWWLYSVTSWGLVGLMAILGLYWGYAGLILRGTGLVGTRAHDVDRKLTRAWEWLHLRPPTVRVLLTAAVWVAAAEWFRGFWPWHGLPWLYLGYTQSPALVVCQIADVVGVGGVSFLVVVFNAWVTLWVLDRLRIRRLIASGGVVLGLVVLTVIYGQYRLKTEPSLFVPGPKVMVVQPNFPQSNTGDKGATLEQLVDYHLKATESAMAKDPDTDVVVWSETMMPPFNDYTLQTLSGDGVAFAGFTRQAIASMARRTHAAVLTGGTSIAEVAVNGKGQVIREDKSNVAYFMTRVGKLSPVVYRKIHLVPFGEFVPFKDGWPWLHEQIKRFGPKDMEFYSLTPGKDDELPVFSLDRKPSTLPPWRLSAPICFEDIDADLCAEMARPDPATPAVKRTEVLINLTNDGWFAANENSQHMQATIFRSIENRLPLARSVNTGISGFVDPVGRGSGLLAARTEGVSTQVVWLDNRVTIFTRVGQLFARVCTVVTVVIAIAALGAWVVRKFSRGVRPEPA